MFPLEKGPLPEGCPPHIIYLMRPRAHMMQWVADQIKYGQPVPSLFLLLANNLSLPARATPSASAHRLDLLRNTLPPHAAGTSPLGPLATPTTAGITTTNHFD